LGDGVELSGAELTEVGFAEEGPPETADSVFDAALLPWRMGIAEVRLDAELIGEASVSGELGAVIEGDG